jgi:SAM-dependent MidA family methyltransferase
VTAFERTLSDLIAHEGPISVERYMRLCLQHYYATRDPLGAAGDFITAPEISQMFGELIGLWAAEVWHMMGRPNPVRFVELGPGRGTLMADALRAAKLVPAFRESATVHLVETSPTLRERQGQTLSSSGVRLAWHDRLDEVPPGPAIVVANEFFDALPVRQFVATERGWCERLVGVRDDGFFFGLDAEPAANLPPPQRLGDVLEWPREAMALAAELAGRLAADRGAALIIDYGHWGPAFGDTLQALHAHGFADPLQRPGEADLTTHVDFNRIAAAAEDRVRVHGPIQQGDFLEALGIRARAAALTARATSAQAAAIGQALDRLTARGPTGMGELFKVLGLSDPALATLPGLPAQPFGTR